MDGLFAAFPIHESFQGRHFCGSSNKFRIRKRAPLDVTDAVTSCSRGWTTQRRPSAVRHLVPGLSSPLRRARSPEAMEPKGGAVLHVVVVGFHHKKGGQVRATATGDQGFTCVVASGVRRMQCGSGSTLTRRVWPDGTSPESGIRTTSLKTWN